VRQIVAGDPKTPMQQQRPQILTHPPTPPPPHPPTICEVQRRPLQPDDVVPPRLRVVRLDARLEKVHRLVPPRQPLLAAAAAAGAQPLLGLLQQVGCTGVWGRQAGRRAGKQLRRLAGRQVGRQAQSRRGQGGKRRLGQGWLGGAITSSFGE
jgi:hypothetical protein